MNVKPKHQKEVHHENFSSCKNLDRLPCYQFEKKITSSIFPSVIFFQLPEKQPWFEFWKSLRFTDAAQIIPADSNRQLEYYRKRIGGWDHFPNKQSSEPIDSWINGPRRDANRWSFKAEVLRHFGLKICMPKKLQGDLFLEITQFSKGYNKSISLFSAGWYIGFNSRKHHRRPWRREWGYHKFFKGTDISNFVGDSADL